MPEISRFFGIIIRMYFDDHNPPHFHAIYGSQEIQVGIDPIMVHDIQTFIFRLKRQGIGVLITDHRVRETLEITDRAYIIHAGCVLQSGIPQELVESPEVKQIYLGEGFSFPIENNEGF